MDKNFILQIGGGKESLPALLCAKNKGFKVVVLDKDPSCYCRKLADEFVHASVYNAEEALEAIKKSDFQNFIAGVFSLGVDAPETNATVAHYLNLPGIPIEAAKICSNKILMKEYLTQRGINMPQYKEVHNVDEIVEFSKSVGFPLVIKPADSRGARGVLILKNDINIKEFFDIAIAESKSRRVIIEKYCWGPQISSETIIANGKAYTFGLSDRNYDRLDEFFPNIIEDGGELPSRFSMQYSEIINSEVQKIAHHLNIVNGTIKGDIVIENSEVKFIEIAPRLSGGYFASHEVPYSTGYNFLDAALDISIGKKPHVFNNDYTKNKCVVQRYLFAKPGVIEDISIPENIKSDPDVLYFDVYFKVGTKVQHTISHPNRGGVIMTTGSNIETAQKKAQSCLDSIKIKQRPL